MSIFELPSGSGGNYLEVRSLQLGLNIPTVNILGISSVSIQENLIISGSIPLQVIGTTTISDQTGIQAVTPVDFLASTSIIIDTTGTINYISTSGSVYSVDLYNTLNGTLSVSHTGNDSVSGTLNTTRPQDLPGRIIVTQPQFLDGLLTIVGGGTVNLSGTTSVSYEYIRELPGTLRVKNDIDLDGVLVTSRTGSADLSSSITICEYALLSGTIFVTPVKLLSGTITTTAPALLNAKLITTEPKYLAGTIVTTKPASDISGTIITTSPTYISGTLTTLDLYQQLLSGTMLVINGKSLVDISGSIVTTEPKYLSGTVVVASLFSGHLDLPSSITVASIQSKLLNGQIQVSSQFKEVSGTINVWGPAYLDGLVEVLRPYADLSGTIQLFPHNDLSGTISIDAVQAILDASLSVQDTKYLDLSGSVQISKYTSDMDGLLDIKGGSVDLNASISVDLYSAFKDLQSVIMVMRASINRDIPGQLTVYPHSDLSGLLITEKNKSDLSGTLTVIPRFDNNIEIDSLYIQDSYVSQIVKLTPISGTTELDVIDISQSDSFTFELLPHIRGTGTETIIINQNDSFDLFMYGEETTEWSYPIQLTDNLMTGNDYSLPTTTEFDGQVYVSYNHNFNNELLRTIVVKTQNDKVPENKKWVVSNIYPETFSGQFVGPNAQMILEQANGFILHPGPQASESNDFFTSDIKFSPEAYDIEASMYRDLWETIQYQMLKDGVISYPPEQWGFNPLSEQIDGPADPFDSIPKHGLFTPVNDGYYQDFNNFFTGNG